MAYKKQKRKYPYDNAMNKSSNAYQMAGKTASESAQVKVP